MRTIFAPIRHALDAMTTTIVSEMHMSQEQGGVLSHTPIHILSVESRIHSTVPMTYRVARLGESVEKDTNPRTGKKAQVQLEAPYYVYELISVPGVAKAPLSTTHQIDCCGNRRQKEGHNG